MNEKYQIPFEHTTAIKVRLSGLTRGSTGNGRARDTVNHLFVKEAFQEGRLSREADTYLCDPNSTPRFPSGEGEHDEPREVTCSSCLDLMERWRKEPFAVVSSARVVEREDGRFKVVYDTEGYQTTGRVKSIVDDRESAERIAQRFEGTELDRDHFIP